MTTPPIVRVRGEAVMEVDPEIARLTLVTSARDKDRRRALDRLAARNDAVLARIRSFGEAVEDAETGVLNVHPQLHHGRGERVRGYHGSVRIRLTVGDFDAMSTMIGEFADQDLTEVVGPSWELRPASPMYGRARSQAVEETVTRARTYAEALGGTLTGLREIADVGLSSRAEPAPGLPPPAGQEAFRGARPDEPGAPPPRVEVGVPRITLRADVEATFTMSEPTALGQPPAGA
ncbi:SIMPL domain-containing protein [Spiractinospora alimapuensis]|uniref:SIMPL domain-containing protein n=1 Tax=Spiractinospora alimapuensis TaxID=2820884 RepID=UPI001F24FA07|nr:SIMPL domain-containing protein [Spiractinospora alimapuensis]QVQ50476.1 SIMPL domain-containing protein [Spiractinospora alimapuensis]